MRKALILSHHLDNDTPAYGNKTDQISISEVSSIDKGDSANALKLEFSNHIGTHIDFPKHFCSGGKSLNDYDDTFWLFKNVGFVQTSFERLENVLERLDRSIDMLIVKTGFEQYRGSERYTLEQPVICSSLASILRSRFPKLRVLGFDMISISSYRDRDMGRKAHRAFLCEYDILLIEDMKLTDLDTSPSNVIVAPLLIDGADGVPCFVYTMDI